MISASYITVENIAAIPSEQSIGAPRGGTREQKNTGKRCISRGVIRIMDIMKILANHSPEDMAKVPLRPIYGKSTAHPAKNAPGMPMRLRITCCKDNDECK